MIHEYIESLVNLGNHDSFSNKFKGHRVIIYYQEYKSPKNL